VELKLNPSIGKQTAMQSDEVYVPLEYTRTLDKVYRFYKDGHVQNIKYHLMPSISGHVCIAATVFPSMRKDQIYYVTIVIDESSAYVATACCACPASLSGCCNHVTATLYCFEDYTHCGLINRKVVQSFYKCGTSQEKERPTDDVCLSKQEYGIKK